MIKDKFKDRFPEFAFANFDECELIDFDNYLNLLSEIDKEVEKEREELVIAANQLLNYLYANGTGKLQEITFLEPIESLISKYSKG